MERFSGESAFRHDETPAVGVLVANLGTPAAPTPPALRRFLRQFLSDPRVVELPRPLWWLILNLLVLPRRPARSARLYRRIWTPEGSPLLVISRRQTVLIEAALRRTVASPLHVALGMRYGQPSIAAALRELRGRSCRRIVVLPLYPQYSSATTGSTFDAVTAELSRWRWVPELRTVSSYYDHPGYIAALAASVREAWRSGGEAERLLFSFHGIPKRTFLAGDPYFCHCQKTGRLVAEALGLPPERWRVSFQSRFGREEWLTPYTIDTLEAWGREGLASCDVICPGFSADCLETLEEIAITNREAFEAAGGGRFRYLGALNDRSDHVAALVDVLRGPLGGWVETAGDWNAAAARERADATRKRAAAMGAER